MNSGSSLGSNVSGCRSFILGLVKMLTAAVAYEKFADWNPEPEIHVRELFLPVITVPHSVCVTESRGSPVQGYRPPGALCKVTPCSIHF